MKIILPLLMLVVGVAGGGAAGFFLRETPEVTDPGDTAETETAEVEDAKAPAPPVAEDVSYVKMNNQFVIPVLENERVSALVVLSIGLEVVEGSSEMVYAAEPNLRDAFLSELFDHAYAGGFSENFVNSPSLDRLRLRLLDAATIALPDTITKVLITDIVRQDT